MLTSPNNRMTCRPEKSLFILGEWVPPFAQDLPLVISGCRYDITCYDDTEFNTCGVPFCPTLEKAAFKRRAEYLAGRHCAGNALAQVGLVNQTVATGPHRCPIWPSRAKGSISHTSDIAVAAVTREPVINGVGIDIEAVVPDAMAEELARLVLTGDEHHLLASTDDSKGLFFSSIFSIKESFFKAVFPLVQGYFGFDAVEVTMLDPKTQRFQLRVQQDLHPGLVKGDCHQGNFLCHEGMVCSLFLLRERWCSAPRYGTA